VARNSKEDVAGGRWPVARNSKEGVAGGRWPVARNSKEDVAGGRWPVARNSKEDVAGGRWPVARNSKEDVAGGRWPVARNSKEDVAGGRWPVARKEGVMTSAVRSFEDLEVWRLAMDLVPNVYRLTERLPKHELFGLTGQIRRAAVSVSANIAEGQARYHTKEFLHHLSIARGSLAELFTLALLAERLSYLSPLEREGLAEKIAHVRKLLSGLIKSLNNRS
jgi:four helix bundle protein